jgi:phosphopantetheinyl transferase
MFGTQIPSKKAEGLDPPIAYNVSHDNALVVMAFAPGIHGAPAYNIGVDIMKVRIPGRDTFASFVHTVRDQVNLTSTPSPVKSFSSSVNAPRASLLVQTRDIAR